MKENTKIIIGKKGLKQELYELAINPLKIEVYGLVGGKDLFKPTSIYRCYSNLRNESQYRNIFDLHSKFHSLHPELGFVISPPELLAIFERMKNAKEKPVGIYHSHKYHDTFPTSLDVKTHFDESLLCYIIGVQDISNPELKVFSIKNNKCEELIYNEKI